MKATKLKSVQETCQKAHHRIRAPMEIENNALLSSAILDLGPEGFVINRPLCLLDGPFHQRCSSLQP